MCFFVLQDHLIVGLSWIDLIAQEDPVEESEASIDVPDPADRQTVDLLAVTLSLEPDQVNDAAEKSQQEKELTVMYVQIRSS